MAPHSSPLAWKIPWTEEPDRLQSMGSLRVGDDWASSLSLFTFMHWRRKWQPTPVFLSGECQGPGSLVGCGLPSVGSHRVGHDWSDLAAAAAVQCYELPSIVLQELGLSDLIPWIYLSSSLLSKGIWFNSYLNGLVVFPTFFSLSLNFAIRTLWSEPQSSPDLFLLTV